MANRLSKITILKIFVLTIGIVWSGLSPSAADDDTFAAVAYSPVTRTIGISQKQSSQSDAESAALQDCKTRSSKPDDCRGANWTRNACVAVAIGKTGGWGAAWGNDTGLAADNAVTKCKEYDKSCKVVQNICSNGN
jgi:hypothetical protein